MMAPVTLGHWTVVSRSTTPCGTTADVSRVSCVSLTTWKSLESVLGCLVSSTPAHMDVTYFGNRVLADVIKLRCHQQDGFLFQN